MPWKALLARTGIAGADVRVLTGIGLLVAAVLALNAVGGWLAELAAPQSTYPNEGVVDSIWIALALLYVVVMALPFVPGIELGLALMLMLGDAGIVLVYFCTQVALALSFVCGRCVPRQLLAGLIRAPKFERAERVLACFESTPPANRGDCLCSYLPSRWGGKLLKHRYLALGAALNVPGNALLGGAGGIGFIAGASRLYSLPRFFLLMAAATSPVPILLLLSGA